MLTALVAVVAASTASAATLRRSGGACVIGCESTDGTGFGDLPPPVDLFDEVIPFPTTPDGSGADEPIILPGAPDLPSLRETAPIRPGLVPEAAFPEEDR